MRLICHFAFVCLASVSLSAAEYFVATNGNDTASGTMAQPLRTIQKGVERATRPGDTVTVLPGRYFESVTVRASGEPGRPIVIRSATKQAAVLDGAERVQGWRVLDAAQNVWGVEFGHKAPYNNSRGRWDMPPRAEQVFVDGKRCEHVKEGAGNGGMTEYSFTATQTDPVRYALKLPRGVDPNAATTEITTRTSLLKFGHVNHIVIDGFVFRRAQNTYQEQMVGLAGEACEFLNNLCEYSSGGSGLGLGSRGHIHDNIFRFNGQFGFAAGGPGNLVENNIVATNDFAHYTEWGTGGTKIVGSGNILRHNQFLGNLGGVAIWIDCGPCDNVIEQNYLCGNCGEGIRVEISFRNYIGYNLVEQTRECVPFEFGKSGKPHNVAISVQNSAATLVCNNLLKDNTGLGLQLATYNRPADDLPKWQERHGDPQQLQWLRRSWQSKVVLAYSNLFLNNVVLQNTSDASKPCVYLMGLVNGQKPHCYGNLFDYNFYWNSATRAPKVLYRNSAEVPSGKSEWQTKLGFDVHALGGFSPAAYQQPLFAAQYPYAPTAAFAGLGKGAPARAFPGHQEKDFLGHPAPAGSTAIGHIVH